METLVKIIEITINIVSSVLAVLIALNIHDIMKDAMKRKEFEEICKKMQEDYFEGFENISPGDMNTLTEKEEKELKKELKKRVVNKNINPNTGKPWSKSTLRRRNK